MYKINKKFFMKNKNLLKLLISNLNNKFKFTPLLIKKQDIGKTNYYPYYGKEWNNIGYFYNQDVIKKIPFFNILIERLAKSYFNLFFKNYKKKGISSKKRSYLIKRIYISKPEIKYTNSLGIVTFYTMNTLSSILKKYDNHLNYLFFNDKWTQKSVYINTKEKGKVWVKKWPISIINQFLRPNFLNYMGYKVLYILESNNKLNNNNIEIIPYKKGTFEINIKNIKEILKYKFQFQNKRLELFYLDVLRLRIIDIKDEYSKYLEKIWNYDQQNFKNFIILNNNSSFIIKLKKMLSKILKVKIELNIINIKSQYYNPYFITESLALKLKNTKTNVIKQMVRIINKSNISNYDNNKYKTLKVKEENNLKNISLISIINNNKNLSKVLKTLYYTNKIITSNVNKIYYNILNKNYNNICNIVFNSIKYKEITGIRLEVKGRLTKRYRADRSIYKLLWKGGLKNKDSSLKGLSSILYRGNQQSNIMYSLSSNKRRIGSFAIKGWISGK